jgi:hypothetical protein
VVAPNAADLELGYLRAHLLHKSDNFVPGYHGIDCVAPFVARLVNVRVANATELNGDMNVFRTGLTMLVLKWCEGGGGRLRSIAGF